MYLPPHLSIGIHCCSSCLAPGTYHYSTIVSGKQISKRKDTTVQDNNPVLRIVCLKTIVAWKVKLHGVNFHICCISHQASILQQVSIPYNILHTDSCLCEDCIHASCAEWYPRKPAYSLLMNKTSGNVSRGIKNSFFFSSSMLTVMGWSAVRLCLLIAATIWTSSSGFLPYGEKKTLKMFVTCMISTKTLHVHYINNKYRWNLKTSKLQTSNNQPKLIMYLEMNPRVAIQI